MASLGTRVCLDMSRMRMFLERENEIKPENHFRINEKFDEAFTGDLLIMRQEARKAQSLAASLNSTAAHWPG